MRRVCASRRAQSRELSKSSSPSKVGARVVSATTTCCAPSEAHGKQERNDTHTQTDGRTDGQRKEAARRCRSLAAACQGCNLLIVARGLRRRCRKLARPRHCRPLITANRKHRELAYLAAAAANRKPTLRRAATCVWRVRKMINVKPAGERVSLPLSLAAAATAASSLKARARNTVRVVT